MFDQVPDKSSKKRFTKKRKVNEVVISYTQKESNNNKPKNKTTPRRQQIPDSRQSSLDSKDSRQSNWNSQTLTDAPLPYGWKMCFEKTEKGGKVVMVAAYMDPFGQVFKREENGFSKELLDFFKSYYECNFFSL